jgi:5'-3' exonuclease
LYGYNNYFLTLDPENDELFSMRDLLQDSSENRSNQDEFQDNMHASVRGIKSLTDTLKEQIRSSKPSDKDAQEQIYKTKLKVNDLINDLSDSLNRMKEQFKDEASECVALVSAHKHELSRI